MAVTQIPPYELEYLTKKHVTEVFELDCRSCTYYDEDIQLDIVHPHAWTKLSLNEFLKQKVPPTHGYVMKLPESKTPKRIVAYCAYELYPEELHLIGFAVDPRFRGQGLGLALMLKLHKSLLQSPERKTVSIHVREHDDASIGFFKALKFRSKLERRYFDDGEDGIHFWFTEKQTVTEDGSEW